MSQYPDILTKLAALTADASEDWKDHPRNRALIALVQEAVAEIERIREAAQNLIDTFKIGDDIVKDGVPRFVANAIATTALHQLNRALNPQEATP